MLLLALSAIYRLVVMYGGGEFHIERGGDPWLTCADSYNVVPAFIDQLRFSGKRA